MALGQPCDRPGDSEVNLTNHYDDVIMGAMASQITSLALIYSTVYSDADQRKHQSSASLAFVPGIHRGPVNSPHKWPVTRKMFPFHDVIIYLQVQRTCYFQALPSFQMFTGPTSMIDKTIYTTLAHREL